MYSIKPSHSSGEFHLHRRMETARFLMIQRGQRVEEAGSAVGYPDPASFSRMFRRVVGKSPRQSLKEAHGERRKA